MNYKATITTLTPLHIGTGTELLNLYDFVVDEKRDCTYRLNTDVILDDWLTSNNDRFDSAMLSRPPAELVDLPTLRKRAEFSVYVLKGTPQPKTEGAGRIREQVKDVWGKLYLPGSSLKGALRTVIARSILSDKDFKSYPKVNMSGKPKEADDWIEETVFGSDPHHDLLRALHITDSKSIETKPWLINVRVVKEKKIESPVDIEAIPGETTFEATIHTDEYLYRDMAKQLGWESVQTKWLYNLPVAGRNTATKRLKAEAAYYKAIGWPSLASVCNQWIADLKTLRGSNGFFLQVGWGGGWNNTTLGQDFIVNDENEFVKIRNRFNLGRPPKRNVKWKAEAGQRFPASRRLVVNSSAQPISPLGWVYITLNKI